MLSEQGPVESWLRALVREAIVGQPDLSADVGSIDISGGSKLGEARAYLEPTGNADPDNAWGTLASALEAHPAFDRAVPVPPSVHITLAPTVLEAGLVECLGKVPLIPRQADTDIVVVFCSPNTNKPLHIGHLRACFVGMSVSRLFEAQGVQVARSQMLSNFGIHMCQALTMHDGVTDPMVEGVKGDHFVGGLYRSYHDALRQTRDWGCDGYDCMASEDERPCLRCRPYELLRRMSAGDAGLLEANKRLAEWAIDGILATQARVGTTHDTCLRESEVIALAVQELDRAVDAGVCQRRPDGSTYIPVHSTGDAELTLLRRDGTSLVFSMLLGVYLRRASIYPGRQVVELTGEQWRAGRTAMYEILLRIGRDDLSGSTEGVFFGMVQLGGKIMQSRSGGAVVADDLLDRIANRVASETLPRSLQELDVPPESLAVALLKYHILRFPRAEGFDFDEEAMWGDSCARFGSLISTLAWAEGKDERSSTRESNGQSRVEERSLSLALARHSLFASRALAKRDPAILVRYLDDLARRQISAARRGVASSSVHLVTADVVRRSLLLLGIDDVVLPSANSSLRR
jgi:arginyl-tRNA synthetase